jgi:hypothetical protein
LAFSSLHDKMEIVMIFHIRLPANMRFEPLRYDPSFEVIAPDEEATNWTDYRDDAPDQPKNFRRYGPCESCGSR